jgi:hypothetical protein
MAAPPFAVLVDYSTAFAARTVFLDDFIIDNAAKRGYTAFALY